MDQLRLSVRRDRLVARDPPIVARSFSQTDLPRRFCRGYASRDIPGSARRVEVSVAATAIAAIVLDVMMPRVSGFDVLSSVRTRYNARSANRSDCGYIGEFGLIR